MRVILLLVGLIYASQIFGQDIKETNTKMEAFVSRTGVIVKFEDFRLPDIKTNYGVVEAKVRKITSGGETQYFYQISNEGKYSSKKASVAYEDLIEMQKALSSLKSQAVSDANTRSDYIENKFITDDGFQVGYYVGNKKISWYIQLERYGDGNTIFINDVSAIEDAFFKAKSKMDELRN